MDQTRSKSGLLLHESGKASSRVGLGTLGSPEEQPMLPNRMEVIVKVDGNGHALLSLPRGSSAASSGGRRRPAARCRSTSTWRWRSLAGRRSCARTRPSPARSRGTTACRCRNPIRVTPPRPVPPILTPTTAGSATTTTVRLSGARLRLPQRERGRLAVARLVPHSLSKIDIY
jgi:hypothetical protein